MIKINVRHPLKKSISIFVNDFFSIETITDLFDEDLNDGGTFSIPISIIATDEIRNFLDFPESFSINQNMKYDCDVYADDVQILNDVTIEFESVEGRLDITNNTYSFVILGERSKLGTKMLNKKLSDFAMGGIIDWSQTFGLGIGSRIFAYEVMLGYSPQYAYKLAFAPVKIFDYIDDTRSDYSGDIMQNDIVNKILENKKYNDNWIFGADKLGVPNEAVDEQNPEYAEYRTVPFFKITFILKEIFKELGYVLEGDFFNIPDVEDMYIFNNHSIERYNWPAYADTNSIIDPKNHVPDLLLVDFYAAVKNFFCLKQIIVGNTIYLNKKMNLNTELDVSNNVLQNFTNGTKTDVNKNGVKIEFNFGNEDSYATDNTSNNTKIEVIATVAVYTDIASLAITPIDGNYILVTAENYYYRYDVSQAIWIPELEALEGFVTGANPKTKEIALSPLCQLYTTSPSGLKSWQNMPAVRQAGSYYSNGKVNVINPCGLRIFYIKNLAWNNSSAMPVAFTHDTDLANTKRATMSLSILGTYGLYNMLHKNFITKLLKSWKLQIQFKTPINKLPSADVLRNANKLFFVKSYATNLLDGITDAELITID
jgi:hypothetical protein